MTKKSLLFVESPLQLLNAYEAISYFNLENYSYIVRLSNNETSDKQIISLLSLLKISTSNIKYVCLRTIKRTLFDYATLLFYRYKYIFVKNIDTVFIGNYESGFFKLIMKQFSKQNIILLDDGAKTISIQDKFTKTNYYHLFSMYNLEKLSGQVIYKNEYANLSKSLKTLKKDSNFILFLGMKLSEIDIISEKYYIALVNKISNYYNDKNIIYIPHREEDTKKIEKILLNKNIRIKYIDYPVELYGLNEKEIPCIVSSFYSTAVLNMKNIYHINAECFKFNYTDSKYKDTINSVYEHYKKEIKVIDLND